LKLRPKIMGKLLLGFGIVMTLTACTCLYLIRSMQEIDNNYSILIDRKAQAYALTGMALANYNLASDSMRAFVAEEHPSVEIKYYLAIEKGKELEEKIAPLLDEDEVKFYNFFKAKADDFITSSGQVIKLVKARETSSDDDDRTDSNKNLYEYLAANENVLTGAVSVGQTLANYLSQNLNNHKANNKASVQKAIRFSTGLVAFVLVFGLAVVYLVARSVTVPIRRVDSEAAKIASGDLTGSEINIKSEDEAGHLAQSFNTMLVNLKDIVGQLQEKSGTVSALAGTLSGNADNVSAASNETASTISQVGSMMDQVADSARHISDASVRTAGFAKSGNEGLQNVSAQISVITETTTESKVVIGKLNGLSKRISKIVEVITGIADQTNLLALNAAIEAARAGDQGRGFAVVADEVRKLAEQSASAAMEIQGLNTNIQEESQKAVNSMDYSSSQVEKGTLLVKEAGQTFENIITAVQELVSEIQAIATASGEVSLAVQNIAAASEEQTATMEEVSSATQSMAGLAEELNALANRFKLNQQEVGS